MFLDYIPGKKGGSRIRCVENNAFLRTNPVFTHGLFWMKKYSINKQILKQLVWAHFRLIWLKNNSMSGCFSNRFPAETLMKLGGAKEGVDGRKSAEKITGAAAPAAASYGFPDRLDRSWREVFISRLNSAHRNRITVINGGGSCEDYHHFLPLSPWTTCVCSEF